MERIARLGVDVSINSTGVSIIIPKTETSDKKTLYVQICPSDTTVSASVRLLQYKKTYPDYDTYTETDLHKIISADNQARVVYKLLNEIANQYKLTGFDARQEGSVMSTSFKKKQSRINDLTTYNVAMKRMMIQHKLVKSISIVSPNSLKKYATGKGNCAKDLMESTFYEKNPEFHVPTKLNKKKEVVLSTKNDDIADAWHLANAPIPDQDKLIFTHK